MTASVRIVALAMLSIAVLPGTAVGQSRQDETVRRLEQLERRTAELERRIRELEGGDKSDAPRAVPASATGNSRDLSNWRQLRVGMAIDQVRALLGEPSKVEVIGWKIWYFRNDGAVRFDSRSDKVVGWEEPDR